jgi:hypothetical protein
MQYFILIFGKIQIIKKKNKKLDATKQNYFHV